jgi:hypothetical protein
VDGLEAENPEGGALAALYRARAVAEYFIRLGVNRHDIVMLAGKRGDARPGSVGREPLDRNVSVTMTFGS